MAEVVHRAVLHFKIGFGFPVLLKQPVIIVDGLLIVWMGIQKQVEVNQRKTELLQF